MLYLLGVFLLYGAYGTLDIALLAERRPAPSRDLAAVALMTVGLLAKTALFPCTSGCRPRMPARRPRRARCSRRWSSRAPGSWCVRLWFDVFPGVVTVSSAQLLAALGAAAIVVGNVVALRQQRLKLLIAYSTVAQIGYLFLMFPLAAGLDGSASSISRGGHGAACCRRSRMPPPRPRCSWRRDSSTRTLGHDRIADLAARRARCR